jgi:hypothetical protein
MSQTSATNQINWRVSDEDETLISQIVKRECDSYRKDVGRLPRGYALHVRMNVTACHANGNPLDLAGLLAADDFNFSHDINGLDRHVCRDTGKLINCFLPRYSKRDTDTPASTQTFNTAEQSREAA